MEEDDAARDRLAELRSSAKGWHGIQLAALGFIGLCGVLQTSESSNPQSLQVLAGILVLAAFVLACIGIYLVGRAAWPLYRPDPARAHVADQEALEQAGRQLTSGLAMTFTSIAALALATATAWWPADATTGVQVQVQAADGQTFCGRLETGSQPGALRVVTAGEPVDLALDGLRLVRPVDAC